MARRPNAANDEPSAGLPLSWFACPNGECADFNRFEGGNLSVVEWMGKDHRIRRLYCKTCSTRFSERQGSLMQYTKLPAAEVVRIVKCLGHGCSIEATADICEVDPRTVQRLLERAGPRAVDFHRLQLERLEQPLEAVQLDELHGKTVRGKRHAEKGTMPKRLRRRFRKKRARRGFIRLWT